MALVCGERERLESEVERSLFDFGGLILFTFAT